MITSKHLEVQTNHWRTEAASEKKKEAPCTQTLTTDILDISRTNRKVHKWQ